MSGIEFADRYVKDQFWPRVSKRMENGEITVQWLIDWFKRIGGEEANVPPSEFESAEFATYLGGKLGMM